MAVARVHSLDVQQTIWPWAILATSFVVNVVLWVALRGLEGFEKTTGGLASLYVTALFVASVAVARQLPFTLGLGVTRRAFMGGSLLYATASSALAGVVLTLLNRVEEVTDGFGQGGRFFRVPWLTDVPTYQLFAVYAVRCCSPSRWVRSCPGCTRGSARPGCSSRRSWRSWWSRRRCC